MHSITGYTYREMKDLTWIFLLVPTWLSFLSVGHCFNVDIDSAVLHKGPENSYFGFSVVQHLDATGEKRILTGAPRANTSQEGITEGGDVFKCSVGLRPKVIRCQRMSFETGGDETEYDGELLYKPKERRSYQWLGATLASQSNGPINSIMACAPRYVYFSTSLDKRATVGKCIIHGNNGNSETLAPAKSDRNLNLAQEIRAKGFAQYGMSAAMTMDGEWAIVGAVGSYNWSGQLYTHNLTATGKRTVQLPLEHDTTKENITYRGYAVAFGSFSRSSEPDFVVSVPRAYTMIGEVEIYKAVEEPYICKVRGSQMGEYFGNALVVGDFDNNGKDDLAVGAPFYGSPGTNYDTGRIYVFYQKDQKHDGCFLDSKPTHLEGRKTNSERFGYAMATIGDINKDGYLDLAVGAPYGGENGGGAVYIFHGSNTGLRKRFTQVIDESSISHGQGPLKSFGFSLSGGNDIDGNKYPDIVVGAYASDTIIQLWSRPVIKLDIKTVSNRSSIDIDNPNTRIRNSQVASFQITTCIRYWGDSISGTKEFKISGRLGNEEDINPRAFFMLDQSYHQTETTLAKAQATINEDLCVAWDAYIKPGIKDKLNPISVNVSVEMIEDNGAPRAAGTLIEILDPDIPAQQAILVHIEKNCGDDEICVPDLKLTARPKTEVHMHGSEGISLEVYVTVENTVEDEAFEAGLEIIIPEGTTYRKIYDVKAPELPRCNYRSSDESRILYCDLGNPFPGNSRASFTLQVDPENINGSVDELRFGLRVNSSNPEDPKTTDDNTAVASIRIEAKVDVQFTGVSKPEQILYNSSLSSTNKSPTSVGPSINHLYEFWNLGPSKIERAKLMIFWPSHLENGDPFLYLMEVAKVTKGQGNCSFVRQPDFHNNTEKDKRDVEMADGKIRNRRDSSFLDDLKLTGKKAQEKKLIGCSPAQERWCTVFQCDVGPLRKNTEVVIEIYAKLLLKSIVQLNYQTINVTSQATAEVVSLPYGENVKVKKLSIPTVKISTVIAATDVGAGRGGVEIWVVVVSAIGGLTVLGIMIFLLRKCGFFKRTKAGEEDEDDDAADDRVSKRMSGIDTVNRKLIFKNGISISIEEKAYKNF